MNERKPQWLKVKIGEGTPGAVRNAIKEFGLNTICDEANCPNRMECFNKKTATFMILGKNCTRNCTFCNVTKRVPELVNKEEPHNVAMAVKKLKLRHIVITSVTRDDLEDGGAQQFAKVVEEIRALNKSTRIEVLIPDFKGDDKAIETVINSKPDIIGHNIETSHVLYSTVRPMAVYERALYVLRKTKEMAPNILTKSGFMLGLGETEENVLELLKDLKDNKCDIVTIGQYLQPSPAHHAVIEYVHPEVFKKYENMAREMGFKYVFSGPLVRSSYHAEEVFE
ncbi:lipoic acid synthetase [Hathewaya proteolytica DSM 3090]|uniref:Lipoyl synthase n=1 Tax=Hathewaya proteolytica DSM 3090 TaxID=1121331 RepID=A0A1M6J918_9CLOT|nr:lipoyl synthase [Hathewaya proteolytica]SHJ43188.1 lipoic acid synthetase [Hathewaya proteolytica DSM 3090]